MKRMTRCFIAVFAVLLVLTAQVAVCDAATPFRKISLLELTRAQKRRVPIRLHRGVLLHVLKIEKAGSYRKVTIELEAPVPVSVLSAMMFTERPIGTTYEHDNLFTYLVADNPTMSRKVKSFYGASRFYGIRYSYLTGALFNNPDLLLGKMVITTHYANRLMFVFYRAPVVPQ